MSDRRNTRSGSEPPLSLEECRALVTGISKKKRTSRTSRKSTTEPSGNVSTSSEATESDPASHPAGDVESGAMQVWKEMFGGPNEDDFGTVIDQFDYVRIKVGEFLDTAQKKRMIQYITDDLKRKQPGFTESSGLQFSELRERLQKIVTNSIIVGTKLELSAIKDALEEHMEEIKATLEKID